MSEIQIVKVDQGASTPASSPKEAKADFRRVEAASLKMPDPLSPSAEGKRFFARLFNTLQLNTHFISVIARTRLEHEDVAKIEGHHSRPDGRRDRKPQPRHRRRRSAIQRRMASPARRTYDTVAAGWDVHVLSSIGRRFLEVLGKLDQLMPFAADPGDSRR